MSPATRSLFLSIFLVALFGCGSEPAPEHQAAPRDSPVGPGWARHTIDDSSFGADGVRLADIDGNGLVDITSPWEEGDEVRVYLHPGEQAVRDRWPALTVGKVGDPEDSFFADIDGDGVMDVVSACEGTTRSMFIHWAPIDRQELSNPAAWSTDVLPASVDVARWMFAFAMQVDGKNGLDIVAGSRGENGSIGWFEAPADARDVEAWQWHPLYKAGWVMTLSPYDVDRDGDFDIVGTDRRGPGRGALWLENPGADEGSSEPWREHRIGPSNQYEAMHHAIADLDGDGLDDVVTPGRQGAIRLHQQLGQSPPTWNTHEIEMPPNTGFGKGIEVADIDLDGQADLVVSCARAGDGKIGVFWMAFDEQPWEPQWSATSISGPEGFIFDLVRVNDLDGDGDLDVITLEQNLPIGSDELGVVWYENPAR